MRQSKALESLKMQVPTPCDLDHFMDVVSDNLHFPTVILLDEIGDKLNPISLPRVLFIKPTLYIICLGTAANGVNP